MLASLAAGGAGARLRARALAVRDALRDGQLGDPLRTDPWHWPFLLGWTALWFCAKSVKGGQSWHFSVQGAQLLWEGAGRHQLAGGLDLFANYPRLQSGPLTFALAEPISWLSPHHGLVAAQLTMTLLGLLVLVALERAAFALRPDVPASRIRWTVLGGGSVVVPLWALTGVWYAHFDDVLALTFAALGMWAAARHRPLAVGICVALSVDSKPWAAAFLPLLFALPGSAWRGGPRRQAVIACAALLVAAWMPFLMADPNSLNAAGFTISNVPDSALRALGVDDPTTPTWDRPAQIGFGCLFGALAVWRRRWPAAILIGVCARIALEPNDYGYYFAGLILGALFWDLLGAKRPQPIMTLSVTSLIFALPTLGITPQLNGDIKLWTMIGATFAALVAPAQPAPRGRWPRLSTDLPPVALLSAPDPVIDAPAEAAAATVPTPPAPQETRATAPVPAPVPEPVHAQSPARPGEAKPTADVRVHRERHFEGHAEHGSHRTASPASR